MWVPDWGKVCSVRGDIRGLRWVPYERLLWSPLARISELYQLPQKGLIRSFLKYRNQITGEDDRDTEKPILNKIKACSCRKS